MSSSDKIANLAGSLAAKVHSIGGRMTSWLEPKRVPPPPDPSVLASRAKESSKISMHLLARSGRYEEMIRLAETADDREIAVAAVSEISNEASAKQSSLLERLARGNSHAAVPALISLFNQRHLPVALELYLQRLNSGELFELIRLGRARAYSVVELLSVVADDFDDAAILGFFMQVWQSLAHDHGEQVKLLLEILGDPEPKGARYIPEPNLVPAPIKLKAIELLQSADAREYERGLVYATDDPNETVSYQATVALVQFWQSEFGRVPQNVEPFAMLDLGLLFQVCQLSSSFQWRDGVVTSEICDHLADVVAEQDHTDPNHDQARHAELEQLQASLYKQLKELSERRVRSLQPLLDTITTALGLPYLKAVAMDMDEIASYSIGIGRINLSRACLLQDKPLSAEFMGTLLHEIEHMEQDYVMICSIADDLNLTLGQHGKLLIELWTRYSDVVGYAPDHMFLLGILRMRNDRKLSPADHRRAERLLSSHQGTFGNNRRCEAISARIEHLSNAIASLDSGDWDVHLLASLDEQESLQALYQGGRVPEVMVQEMESCRAELDTIIGRLYPDTQPSTMSSIQLAQGLLNTSYAGYISPVVDRLKTVLNKVLQQECQNLRRTKFGLLRSGYFEEEAYAITDRVETIVRALNRGWFAVPEAGS